jgi:hypothetical protein
MSDVIENQTPATDAVEPATISVIDLQNVVKIIDYAAEQGAFKGWEVIRQVAAVREKINVFVEAAAAAQAAQEEAAKAQEDAAKTEAAPADEMPPVKKVKRKTK